MREKKTPDKHAFRSGKKSLSSNGMKPEALLHSRPEGLYCPPGNFFIDPVRPVERALITHAHADHARAGHAAVLATRETLDIMRLRYGGDFTKSKQVAELGERIDLGGVTVSFHPAGHVLGSAQIAVEAKGLRIVASGDYKRHPDATCAPFEPVACDVFITEATFGLPVFVHPDPESEARRLAESLRQFPERAHIVGAYSLGKAQRLISLMRSVGHDAPILIHGALAKISRYYQGRGIKLGKLDPATVEGIAGTRGAGQIIVAPPSVLGDRWTRRFADPLSVFASGWMRIRQRARQRGVELPLILSDHGDWNELTRTIRETGASEVWVTHGREEAIVRWCAINGIAARPLHLVGYEDEAE